VLWIPSGEIVKELGGEALAVGRKAFVLSIHPIAYMR
jgi:hypothetical protein